MPIRLWSTVVSQLSTVDVVSTPRRATAGAWRTRFEGWALVTSTRSGKLPRRAPAAAPEGGEVGAERSARDSTDRVAPHAGAAREDRLAIGGGPGCGLGG